MAQFTVTWKDEGFDFMITTVNIEDDRDPNDVSADEWADLASKEEMAAQGYPWDEEDCALPSEEGYDLISVVRGVPDFIYR